MESAVPLINTFPFLEKILFNFESCVKDYGMTSIAEVYDGDPPHRPNGCISQAWSVSALLYIKYLIEIGKKNLLTL